jgi:hypothetical protein
MADVYLDSDVSYRITEPLQNAGHHVTTAQDIGLKQATDELHLLTAVERGSILITCNVHDYELLHAAWLRWGHKWGITMPHPGILLLPHRRPAELARALIELLAAGDPRPNELWQWQPDRAWVRKRDPELG